MATPATPPTTQLSEAEVRLLADLIASTAVRRQPPYPTMFDAVREAVIEVLAAQPTDEVV
ncbi:MAG TPA: hypothetical protein VMX12_00055 [Acidimicrobiia bacterium]|nr:hypothetical protein [Acidimicrobiia bacterium]